MTKYATLAVAYDSDVTIRENVSELIDFLSKEMQAIVRRNDQTLRNAISFINSGSAGYLNRITAEVHGAFEDIINSVFEMMEEKGLVKKIPNESNYPHWEPTQKLVSSTLPMELKLSKEIQPIDVKQVSMEEHQQALEIIALDFVDRKIIQAMNSTTSGSLLIHAMDPTDLMKRVRGAIMDHVLEFRLSKPLKNTFGIPKEICRVQLVKTLCSMEADLLQSIIDLYCNKGH